MRLITAAISPERFVKVSIHQVIILFLGIHSEPTQRVMSELMVEVRRLTGRYPHLEFKCLARILEESGAFPSLSKSTGRRAEGATEY
jgi:hypothetical protein